jgi:hypothetical protein
MKLSEVLLNQINERDERLGKIDIKAEPMAGKFAVIIGNQRVDIDMELKEYNDLPKTKAVRQLGYVNAYVISDKQQAFYAELIGQLQNLQLQGGNIITKQTISSTGAAGEARTIDPPAIQDLLIIDDKLEFNLIDNNGLLNLRLAEGRKSLNDQVANLLKNKGLMEAVALLNSNEFWSAKKRAFLE